MLELAEAITPRLRALVLLAGFGTLRRGELLGLRRRDVDLLHGTVSVERQAQRLPGVGRFESDPKSKAGRRIVHLPDVVTAALEDHLAAFVAAKAHSLVFVGENGRPLSSAVLYPAFDDARRAVGCPDVTLHDLRHTAGTLAKLARRDNERTDGENGSRVARGSPSLQARFRASRRRFGSADMHRTISSASDGRRGAGETTRAMLAPSRKRAAGRRVGKASSPGVS